MILPIWNTLMVNLLMIHIVLLKNYHWKPNSKKHINSKDTLFNVDLDK